MLDAWIKLGLLYIYPHVYIWRYKSVTVLSRSSNWISPIAQVQGRDEEKPSFSLHLLLFTPGIAVENMLKLHCGLSISEELLKTENKQIQCVGKLLAQFVSHAEILTH